MKSNIKRLFSYTLRYKLSFTVSIIGFLIFAAADVAAVEWIRRVIEFINSSDVVNPLFIAIALILIAFARGLGFFIGNYFMSRVGLGIVHDMRNELFNKLIKLPKIYFDNNQSGQLINRITFTTTQVSGATSNAVKTLVREGALFIGLISYMFYLNWKLTLLLLITAPFIAIIVNIAGRRLRKLAKSIQTAMGDVTHIASEAVEGNTEIKSFNAETYERYRFQKANTSNRNQNLKLEATSNLATPIIQILVSISLGIVAYFALGAQLGINLDSETFVAFFTSAGLMAKPIRQLSSINAIIQKGLAAADEIFDQLDSSDENDQGTLEPLIEGKIQFNDITFGYERSKDILKNINLVIENNETVAIVGKSGSGKSTLIRCINGLNDVQAGSILVEGQEVNDPELDKLELRKKVGMVFQQYNLFPHKTALENVMMAPIRVLKHDKEIAKKAAVDLLRKVGLEDKENAYPGEMSGGQQQRVAIARSLAMNPDVILFDEVTAALDPETVNEVLLTIKRLAEDGMTCILVTHEMGFAREVADHIYFTDGGLIVEHGNPKKFFENAKDPRTKEFLSQIL